MENETQEFVGYTISEAIHRYADRGLFKDFITRQRRWVADGCRTNFKIKNLRKHGGHWEGHNRRERAAKLIDEERKSSRRRLCESIRKLLSSGSLIAYGRRGSPMAPLMEIPPSAWRRLRVFSYPGSVLVEKTNEAIKIYDVRIFPRKGKEARADTQQHFTSNMGTEPGVEQTTFASQRLQTGGSREQTPEEDQKQEAENACYEWLMRIFGESPTEKRFSKPHLQNLALARWNALSKRGFLKLWDIAVRDAKAPAWSRSGRLEKSLQASIAAPI